MGTATGGPSAAGHDVLTDKRDAAPACPALRVIEVRGRPSHQTPRRLARAPAAQAVPQEHGADRGRNPGPHSRPHGGRAVEELSIEPRPSPATRQPSAGRSCATSTDVSAPTIPTSARSRRRLADPSPGPDGDPAVASSCPHLRSGASSARRRAFRPHPRWRRSLRRRPRRAAVATGIPVGQTSVTNHPGGRVLSLVCGEQSDHGSGDRTGHRRDRRHDGGPAPTGSDRSSRHRRAPTGPRAVPGGRGGPCPGPTLLIIGVLE